MQAAALALDAHAPATAPQGWDALDDPQEWQGFSRPAGDGRWTSWIAIEGMWCAACTLAVEDALGACPGVAQVQVNGATGTARVTWSPDTAQPSQWWHALKRAGYGAAPAGDLFTSAPRRREQRMLLWRWLVAGFCMMQVMMYAVPAYVAGPGEITPDIEALLRWASWLMTLPVLLFSSLPFFRSAWRDLRHGRVGMDVPVALGILVAFAASSVATFDPASVLATEVWFDSITMFVFFLLSGRLLEQRLRERTAGALESLTRRLPETIERASAGGCFERVPVRRLAVGDRIRILPGEIVPADGEVLEGEGALDEALLTGESKPVARRPGSHVVAGSQNLGTPVVVRVTRCGGDTRFAQIVELMERAAVDKPRAARLADRVATPFLIAVIVAAAAAGAWWWAAGPAHAVGIAVAVLIVTCPCALSLATPAATLASAGALARRGILVRRLCAIEACAGVDTVVFDKTGTLTHASLILSAVRTRQGASAPQALACAAALARHSLHPASRAIASAAEPAGCEVTDVRELAGKGVQGRVATTAGTEPVAVRLGAPSFCGAPESSSSTSQVCLADELGWLATFELDEDLRPDARNAAEALGRRGVGVELLSGDQPHAAERIALLAGIAQVRGSQTPEDKLARVEALQAAGHRVAMVGDGMNDGPVLARADVSFAMGNAVPLAQARSDFIVSGAQLALVPAVLAQARRTRAVVRQNLAWSAAYNFVCVPLAIAGLMPPWLAGLGMAASSLLVVVNSARLASFAKESA